MFKRLRDRIHRGNGSKTSNQRRDSAKRRNIDVLGSIPVEIWDMITSHLECHDNASLAISCHHLYSIVGPHVWTQLKHNRRERYTFLLTAQDQAYPSHHLCFHCGIFHSGGDSLRQSYLATPSSDWCNPSRSLTRVEHPCPAIAKTSSSAKGTGGSNTPVKRSATNSPTFPEELTLFDNPNGSIPWFLVQQIVRAHRLGNKYGLPPGILNRTDKKSTGRVAAVVNGSKARIVDGKLLIRVSTVAPLDVRKEITKGTFDELVRYTSTCGHFYRLPALNRACYAAVREFRGHADITTTDPITPISHFAASASSSINTSSFANKRQAASPLYRCTQCPTEAQVFIKRAQEYELNSARHTYGGSAPGFVIIVERWLDVGRGEYPDEEEWVGLTRSWRSAKVGRERTEGVKARFEGCEREKMLVLGDGGGYERFARNWGGY